MITDDEWDAFMDDVRTSLDRFAVPQAEPEELRAIVEGTREAIVTAPRKKTLEQRAETR